MRTSVPLLESQSYVAHGSRPYDHAACSGNRR
jgi:hypothetical protein